MFLIPRRQIWTQQPQGAVEIDWQTSRDFGISEVYLGGSPSRLLVSDAVPSRSASIIDSVSDKGKVTSFNAVNGESIGIGTTADAVLGSAATTIAVLRRCRDTTPRASELFAYDQSATNRCLAHAPYSDGNIYWDFGNLTAGSGRLSAAYTKDTAWETLVFVAGQLKGREIWRRGVKIASNTSAKATRPSSVLPFYLGADTTLSAISSDNIDVAMFVVSPNEWTDAQIRRWSENPWQIFKRPDSRIFVPVSAGGGTSLIVQDATHAHNADSPSFSMATYLAVAESLHAHAADNVTLATTGTANLVVQEATHAHVADGVSLTTQWLLAVAEALHSHTAESVTLSLQTALVVLEALHSHTAESVTLSLQTALVVLEALHSHTAENLTLGVTGTANLTIADATSGHTSEAVALTLNSLLAVFDAIHAHAADSLTLDTSNATALTVQESTHAHGADNLGLSLDTWLAIVEAAHGHTADAPTLSTALALQVAESLHAHYADVVVLGFPSAPGSGPTVEEIVAAVLAALNATTIPVDVHKVLTIPVTGNWPTANENADALLARNWP